ncbi:glycosyltransferase family 2 protein [Enterovibrio norvegicus]|uniref:glycosyltransferase family 2 protein n=1 Tax=Enterovibrio norvegicus TaxID=188144 RepID=UPI0035517C5D
MSQHLNNEIPNYSVKFSQGKKFDYCVIIFVINEGDKILKQLARMSRLDILADVVICDGGSIDGSMEEKKLESLAVNTLLVKEDSGKLGSQMRIAFSWALKHTYKGVVVIDGNNKDSVENINDFVDKLEQGYDHIQGSRFVPGGVAINTPKSRLLGLKFVHVPLIRFASGYKYTDTTNGFRGYSRNLLSSDQVSIFRKQFTGYELHYYIAIKAARLGFKCVELPVSREYPKSGITPTKISPIRGNVQVLLKLFKCVIGGYDKK